MMNYTKANALNELDSLTPANIKRANKRWLLDRCKALGITHDTSRKGKSVDDLLKDEIAALILRELKAPRETLPEATALMAVTPEELAVLDTPNVWDGDNKAVADSYVRELIRITSEQFDTVTRKWNAPSSELYSTAARLSTELGGLRSSKTGELLADETRLDTARKVFTHISLAVESMHDHYYHDELTRNYTAFRKTVYDGMRTLIRVKADKDKANLVSRKTDVITIDANRMLQFARLTLESLSNDTTPASLWAQVSCALAIATGRRQAELHATATFTVIDSHTLHFTGQAKTKNEGAAKTVDGYAIPTLVDATLCANALQWLTDNGKRVDTAKASHTRYNKALSVHVKTWFETTVPHEYALEQQRLATRTDDSPKDRFIYHALRQIYALCAVKAFRPAKMQDTLYIASVLGHDPSDPSTNVRYTSDFVLADDSKTTAF